MSGSEKMKMPVILEEDHLSGSRNRKGEGESRRAVRAKRKQKRTLLQSSTSWNSPKQIREILMERSPSPICTEKGNESKIRGDQALEKRI